MKRRFLDLFRKYLNKEEKMSLDKQYVIELQQLIGKKLKNPEMAKKAAQIIEEMIDEKAEGQSDHKTKYKDSSKKSA